MQVSRKCGWLFMFLFTLLGPYANRTNMFVNGTLQLNNVKASDNTDYKCTVRKINYTSPEVYIVTLHVDSRGK